MLATNKELPCQAILEAIRDAKRGDSEALCFIMSDKLDYFINYFELDLRPGYIRKAIARSKS